MDRSNSLPSRFISRQQSETCIQEKQDLLTSFSTSSEDSKTENQNPQAQKLKYILLPMCKNAAVAKETEKSKKRCKSSRRMKIALSCFSIFGCIIIGGIVILQHHLKNAKHCDVDKCKYGTAIGTALATTASAVGVATCTSTLGAGCLMAVVSGITSAGTTASRFEKDFPIVISYEFEC